MHMHQYVRGALCCPLATFINHDPLSAATASRPSPAAASLTALHCFEQGALFCTHTCAHTHTSVQININIFYLMADFVRIAALFMISKACARTRAHTHARAYLPGDAFLMKNVLFKHKANVPKINTKASFIYLLYFAVFLLTYIIFICVGRTHMLTHTHICFVWRGFLLLVCAS